MAVDWKLLAKVRETQKTSAQQKVARQLDVVRQEMKKVQAAESVLEAKKAEKMLYWQQLSSDLNNGTCDLERLKYSKNWSRALDEAIEQAFEQVIEAQAGVIAENEKLNICRGEFRICMGDLEKAKQMQTKTRVERLRQIELRAEDVMDEVSAQRWVRRPLA